MRTSKALIVIGASLITIMLVAALAAPLIAPERPNDIFLAKSLQGPSYDALFGRDENGADVFTQVLYGAQLSLKVSLTVTFITALLGLLIGSLAGYKGRLADTIIMRIIDVFYGFPNFLLALALVAFLGPSTTNLIIAFCLSGWTAYARLVRGEILHLKEREYVQSALSIGTPAHRILMFHLWPNLTGPFLIHMSFSMAGIIIAESSLSFLGLGVPPTTPSWGALLQSGRGVMLEAPHISIFPGLAILTLVLGFNLLGDGLRDHFDPKKN